MPSYKADAKNTNNGVSLHYSRLFFNFEEEDQQVQKSL